MEKTYNPETIEQQCYQTWETNQYFAPRGEGKPYCIMIPPPNVTGSLHMGHGFGITLMDILIRYHRMCGDNTLWQPGTDHAGIATQMVVERQLMLEGKTRLEIGREKFIERIWEWKNFSGGTITKQFRRLGASVDWSRERFTMDETLSQAVREVFIRLYNEGLIYRGTRLVNWDPKLLTAISDLEVVSQEEEGKLWHIRYPLVDSTDTLSTTDALSSTYSASSTDVIIVATTRPETLLGDVALAVHPEDERYKHLIGKHVQLPLTNRTIPIIADDFVDKEFGSGCVKITPAHDFNDYAVGQRHQLTPINIFTPDAHLNTEVPAAYQGLERFAAREQIVKDLEKLGLLEKIEKHISKIPRGDRSGVVVEPYLTQQWFMKMKPLAEPAIAAVESGEVKFIPENWSKTYFQWLHNIEDWCISRQLWWGHRIPAWYDANGQVYVGTNEEDVRSRYKIDAATVLQQDNDVLDTWFSSALWPFSTLGWPDETVDLKTFYPTNVLVTGFDIIFFWVARMIMMGLKFTGKVPFKEVFITGLIRDSDGHKMSKSKGNIIDPLDLIDGIELEELVRKRTQGLMQPAMAQKIEKNTRQQFPEGINTHGTDAVRFTFCSLASYGREIRFDLGRLEGYRNFCNKLWNAARYVLMNTETAATTPSATTSSATDSLATATSDIGSASSQSTTATTITHENLSLPDRWIFSKLQNTIAQAHDAIANYRFDLLAQALYEFTWNEFCDWYLELSKPMLAPTDNADAQRLNTGTRHTLIFVLESLLRLLHPIMPFITEEIWQRVAPLARYNLINSDNPVLPEYSSATSRKRPIAPEEGAETTSTIMLQPYPTVDTDLQNPAIEAEVEWLKNIIVSIRTIRSEMNIAPSRKINVILRKGITIDKERFERNQRLIITLAKLDSIRWLNPGETAPESATALVDDLEILIPMAGLIDKQEESARLNKEIFKLKKDAEKTELKLNNPSFVDRAPSQVVGKERERLQEIQRDLQKLEQQLQRLAAL